MTQLSDEEKRTLLAVGWVQEEVAKLAEGGTTKVD